MKNFKIKDFWMADWAFPIFVGLLSAGVFAGTSMYFVHGIGIFSDVGVAAIFQAGMEGYATEGVSAYSVAAAFGVSFLFARVLEGSLVGILDIGGAIMTGVGIGLPALLIMNGLTAPVESFPLALIVGFLAGLIIGGVVIGVRKFTVGQANSTFGADVMMGAGNQAGRFLGPLIIIAAYGASIPVGVGATIGGLIFYGWKKPIEGGAILGAMVLGLIFPLVIG